MDGSIKVMPSSVAPGFKEPAKRIVFLSHCSEVSIYNHENEIERHTLSVPKARGSITVQCVNNMHSGELEWYVVDMLAVAAGGLTALPATPGRIEWSIPDDIELIPLCSVTRGAVDSRTFSSNCDLHGDGVGKVSRPDGQIASHAPCAYSANNDNAY